MSKSVFIVCAGEYSDKHIVGAFSSEEAANKYIRSNINARDSYGEAYIDGEYIIDSCLEDVVEKPITYLTRFSYTFNINESPSLKVRIKGEYAISSLNELEVNIPCYLDPDIHFNEKKEYDNQNFQSGYLVETKILSEEKIRKILQDYCYQHIQSKLGF